MLLPFYNASSEIPENYTDLYSKDENGLYILQVEAKEGFALENLGALKNALNRQKDMVTQLKTEASKVPDGFDFGQYEKDKLKFDENQNFDREGELKELTIQAQKRVDGEFSALIKEKDGIISKQQNGMIKSARQELYGKLAQEGWEKIVVQGIVESMTKVDIDDGGAKVSYIHDDGSRRNFSEKNGDQREFKDSDFINYLTEHPTFGKLIPAKGHTGNGGQQNYNTNVTNSNVKVISDSDVGSNLEALAAGKVQRAD